VKYEKAVHKKDRDKDQLRRFVCSSPVFDPANPEDQQRINRIAPYTFENVDEDREYKQEPVYPGLGSFHFYHRIDGKLVAMGVTDITKSVLNSQYFIYDPDYSFLSLGVVGAIHEIEFMKMVQKNYNPSLKMYQLGELVLNCSKVNYKLNYKPGILICPRTKQQVPFDDVKDQILNWTRIPIATKQELK
jgi:arginyl-tRNA--protein-N-Asp/Glu arginylyltransferase